MQFWFKYSHAILPIFRKSSRYEFITQNFDPTVSYDQLKTRYSSCSILLHPSIVVIQTCEYRAPPLPLLCTTVIAPKRLDQQTDKIYISRPHALFPANNNAADGMSLTQFEERITYRTVDCASLLLACFVSPQPPLFILVRLLRIYYFCVVAFSIVVLKKRISICTYNNQIAYGT